jgi:integrase
MKQLKKEFPGLTALPDGIAPLHALQNFSSNSLSAQGGICMQGSIISREKCFVCGSALEHDEKRRGCFCKDHPQAAATSFIVRFPGSIYKNFKSYEAAAQSLNYLRYEKGSRKSKFNPDDYRSLRPNSFGALTSKYLERKKSRASYKKIEYMINHAVADFGPARNIKDINGAEIEDYLYRIEGISEKSRHNHSAQLHNFWSWCLSRNVITLAEMPTFPKIEYKLGFRKITNWEVQEEVLNKIKELTYHMNPKIWLGIDMLCNYTKLRPGDLMRIEEDSLDNDGWLTIHNPTKTKNKFKVIKLHEDHINEWRNIQSKYPALPGVLFFRHVKGISNLRPNAKFGVNYLYKQWNKAAALIGLEGVPLYPGTKHTTATETAKLLGTNKARDASGLTNKAFDRYCQVENNASYEVVAEIRKAKREAKVLPFPMKRKPE